MVGKIISHYKIIEKLGEGGMGVVYKAHDLKLDRFVALKFLPPFLSTNVEEKQRFVHEAKATSALQHHNICAIHEIDETLDNQLFIVMDYYEGETLKKKIESKPLKIEEAIEIVIQVAVGLQKAHQKGIIHRDIKPPNIFITEDGIVKILDFGLAKLAGQTLHTKTGSTLGTIAYMSPEQTRGGEIDHRTDIWSLGVILYEMLSGEKPFKGEYDQAVMYNIVQNEPKPIQTYFPDISPEVLQIVNKALKKNSHDRFQSVGEILEILRDDSSKSLAKVTKFTKHNLPIQLTSFIGRKKEIETIKQLLREYRLVTLTGAGGCGKTRLALQAIQEKVEDFPDGVWLVDLAPLSDANRIPEVVASILQVKEEADVPLEVTIINNIKNKNLLILLDNCEHLIAACSEFCEKLMKSVPSIIIIATSREAMKIPGELSWRVPSLSLPKMDLIHKFDEVSKSESILLFQERAKSSLPSFQLSDQNLEAIIKICHRLDGIPLAIELAAARIKLFSPTAILHRLDDRFQLLTGGSRTALERQKTLRATVDWSYDLLSDKEKVLFNRLSVFVGGCDMEAVEDICGFKPLTKENIFEFVSSLIDKSLVVSETNKEGVYRYRLLETIRHYGREKLLEANESSSIRERHFKYFLELAEKAYINHVGEEAAWGNRLELENENLIAALDCVTEKPKLLLQLAGALFWFWRARAHFSVGFRYLENVLTRYDNHDSIYARGLTGYGLLLSLIGDFNNGLIWLNKGLELWRNLGDQREIGFLLTYMGLLYLHYTTEYTKGLECTSEAVDTLEKCNDPKLLLRAKLWNAYGFISQFQPDEAEPLVLEISKSAKALKMQWDPLIAQHMYGDCAIMKENYVESEKRYGEAVRMGFKIGDIQQTAYDMQGVAMSLAGQGKFKKALLLNGAAVAKCEELGASPESIIFWSKLISKTIGQARIELDEKAADEFEQKGRQLGFEKAVEYALEFDKD